MSKQKYNIEHKNYAAKVDDTFWFFEERIGGMPASFGGINTSFGMDMTMPFLEQQNWEEYDMSVTSYTVTFK